MALKDYIKHRPLASKKWAEIKDISSYHIHGRPPRRLFISRRPLESTSEYALTYRLDNYQPITKQPFKTAIDAIIEAANHIFVQEENVNDNTKAFLKEHTIKIAGKTYHLKDYIIQYVGRQIESDPNAVLVHVPVHPTEEFIPSFREEIPNFDDVQNQQVKINIELVSSDFIQKISEEELVYEAGEYFYHVDKDGNELFAPYYYILTAEFTRLCIPFHTEDGIDYRIEEFYVNDLEDVPFDVIGSNPVFELIEEEVVEYHEPTYSGALAIGNEVLGVKSDSQIVDTRFTYPEKIAHYQTCGYPGCILCSDPDSPYAGIYVNYDEDTCTVCSGCKGSGKVAPDTSPFGTHIIAKDDMFDSETGKFIPPIAFITPPLESPEYLDKKWRLDFQLMEKALFIMSQNMTNQSEKRAQIDVRQKVTVITNAVKNIYSIYQKSLNTIQGYFRGEENIILHLPVDFNIKTSQDITQELADAKDTSSLYTSELTRELFLKKFGNTSTTRKEIDFLELNDKLFGFTMEEIVKAKAIYGKDLTIRDQVIHDKGHAVLKMLAQEEGFEAMSDEALKAAFDKEIDKIMNITSEESEILEDPLAQLEAEARSKLKGTVGGVQGIISINQAVADGAMTEASAEVLLIEIYGLPPEIAARLIEKTTGGVPTPLSSLA